MEKNKVKFWVDLTMFVTFLVIAISGFILWLVYPAGKKSGQIGVKFLFDRFTWLEIHNWVSVVFIALLFMHLILNLRWIIAMFKRIGK